MAAVASYGCTMHEDELPQQSEIMTEGAEKPERSQEYKELCLQAARKAGVADKTLEWLEDPNSEELLSSRLEMQDELWAKQVMTECWIWAGKFFPVE